MTKAEQLLQQAIGVESMFRFIEGKVKAQKLQVEQARKDRSALGMFEDCGEFYRENFERESASLSAMTELMVSTEKYMKKLRHEAREAESKPIRTDLIDGSYGSDSHAGYGGWGHN